MLIGATHILGPIPARSLDPLLLIQSQLPDMRGYVVLSSGERANSLNFSGERTWDAIFLAGNCEPDFLQLTETARRLVPFERIQHEIQSTGKEDWAVHLFEAPERLLREFLSITQADPVLKVTLDSLDLRQVEALLAGAPACKGLLERSDCTGELPQFELTRISTVVDELGIPFTLPNLQLGYDKGGMALYHLDPALDKPASENRTRADKTPLHSLKAGKGAGGKRRPSEPISSSLATPGSFKPTFTMPGPPGYSMMILGCRNAGAPGSHDSSTSANETDPVPVIFQRLFRSFRKKGVDCLGGRWEDALRSAVDRVRFLAPEFQADALTASTAPLMLDLILEVIASAPMLKRSRLRESALLLIADIYDK
ncbi:MAG: hypothetical protein H6Q29_884, partial [Bacteroidetes bacterium]|nr:hypothetical protein [Bacteroidota bacterium]